MSNEVHGLRMTRKAAKSMFPEEFRISEEFEKKLNGLIFETLQANGGKDRKVFAAITASLTMELVKLFAITRTDPLSVIKTFTDVLMTTYREYFNLDDDKDDKEA